MLASYDSQGNIDENSLKENINKIEGIEKQIEEITYPLIIKIDGIEVNVTEYIQGTIIKISAPKNSKIIIKSGNEEIGKTENGIDTETGMIQLSNKHQNEQVTVQCILNEEVIYEKEIVLKKINNIKMYPCEENGDGKALYWYGMELTPFQEGPVTYSTTHNMSGGICTRNENSMNLYFNDPDYNAQHGIGVNCKTDVTDYNSIDIKVKNVEASGGFAVVEYMVGNKPNDYTALDKVKIEDLIAENGAYITEGQKNINISEITGEKYVSIINFNPAGPGSQAYGTCSLDIEEIVLR